MNRNKKNLHKKVTANVLGLTLASVVAAGAVTDVTVPVFAAQQTQEKENTTAASIYVNGTAADEKADGSTKEKAVSSLEKALSLTGDKGTVLVCGTVTVNTEKKLIIPAGVSIKRAEGFTGALVKITGKGRLTIVGNQLSASDVDTSAAEAGKNAFVTGQAEETKKKGTVNIPSQVTVASLEEWKSFDFSAAGFSGEGTFAWRDKAEPSVYESSLQVVFTPKDTEQYDYTQVSGWDQDTKTVVKTVKVTVEELKPQEKQEGSVTIPAQVNLQKKAEWTDFDFAAAGFMGTGSFAWENQAEPDAYETERKVVFTPSDTKEKDYSQVSGWNEETGTVVRTVKVVTGELKNPEPETKPEDNTEKPGDSTDKGDTEKTENGTDKEDSQKPENSTDKGDTEKPEDGTDKKDEIQKPESPQDNGEKDETDKTDSEDQQEDKEDSDKVVITPIEEEKTPEKGETTEEDVDYSAEQGKTGEVADKAPEVVPVGSLIDETTGVQVSGDFLPFYVDLQVSYNDAVSELPDAGIGEILSAYELKLWDLKENEEYKLPEGKKVKVLIPLPENANCYSELSIAHYLGNNEYEYFVFDRDGKVGNMFVEEVDGKEYLSFETASFSPFNVGGHQIVGPGTISNNHKPSTGTAAGSSGSTAGGTTQTTQNSRTTGTAANTNTNTQSAASAAKKSNTKVIRTVKTGDENNIMIYLLAGGAAVVLAVIAIIFGKKKK
ncbi:MAG TPA: LPXTG cell wall anchor domain-containing protein [Candidatus Blautia stercoravium]|nr:LPXTG cell wall anchor domain-containing protein [Candidatus Blautia stercoravium]